MSDVCTCASCSPIGQEAKLKLDSHEMMATSKPEARSAMTNPVQHVIDYTVKNGGGTFEQGTYLPFEPRVGYAVAVGGVSLPLEDADLGTVRRFSKAVVTEYGASFLGTWLDNGRLYLDAVAYVRDRGSAIQLGLLNKQKAIYDFAAKRPIVLTQEAT